MSIHLYVRRDSGWHVNTTSSNVGESAALSTTWAREIAVSGCFLQKPHKQRLLRQIQHGYKFSVLRSQPRTAATNTDTMNSREGKSMTYRNGGEGGIRTHGTVSRTLAFEASAFNRSATSPRSLQLNRSRASRFSAIRERALCQCT